MIQVPPLSEAPAHGVVTVKRSPRSPTRTALPGTHWACYFESGHQNRPSFDVEDLNRRNPRRLQRTFDRRAIADDHEVHVIDVDVFLRHAHEIVTRHRVDLRRIILEVRLR